MGHNRGNGFTLIELLLALVLITAALVPLLNAIGTTYLTAAESGVSSTATSLAQSKMEELLITPFDSVSSLVKCPVPGYPSYSQEVQVATPLADLKDIKVTISWMVGATKTRDFILETYITR